MKKEGRDNRPSFFNIYYPTTLPLNNMEELVNMIKKIHIFVC